MKLKFTLALAILVLPCITLSAQDRKWVDVESAAIDRTGDAFTVRTVMDYSDLRLRRNEQVEVAPVIVLRSDSLYMEPVYFRAKNRAKEESRIDRFQHHGKDPNQVIVRHGKRHRRTPVAYESSCAFQPWMRDGRLVMMQERTGCHEDEVMYYDLGAVYKPVAPRFTYIFPAYSQGETCYHELMATVNFKVDKSNIETQFEHNDAELQQIYDFIDAVSANPSFKVRKYRLTGYASPEASYQHNDGLSQKRVNALKDKLKAKYGLSDVMFELNNVPEDWDSLRRWVAASDLQYRGEIIRIIDQTAEPDARDAKIRALDNSKTYNFLLHEVYPNLRRTEIVACMDVEPYTMEQARELLDKHPDHLTLRDIYMLNANLPVDSPEYNKLMMVAMRYYGGEPDVIINASSAAIRSRNFGFAEELLSRVADDPRSLNNRGILSVLDGDYDKANEYFRRAAAAGSTEGQYNLENSHWLELAPVK